MILHKWVQGRATMILHPGQVYNFYLLPTLKVCVLILNRFFGALKIFGPVAHASMALNGCDVL